MGVQDRALKLYRRSLCLHFTSGEALGCFEAFYFLQKMFARLRLNHPTVVAIAAKIEEAFSNPINGGPATGCPYLNS